ncbi:DNA-binding transcriptional LysR family regulator OS=Castellaniella defragrans OX=75697 GN=HNR28_000609 PE=3 SV=1 [Castellaniella defragrans]
MQLVYRNRRQVSLTRSGEVFLEQARKLIRDMDQAVALAQRVDKGEVGQLIVGLTVSALYIIFPEIIERFNRRLPEVGVVVREMTMADQEKALRNGDIQVGIGHPPLDDPSLAYKTIATTNFNIVLSERNPLTRRRALSLRDLAGEQFIIFPREIGPQLYDRIISMCQDAGFSPKVIMEASPAQSIIALAASNFGIGFIASTLQQLQRPGVVYRRLDGPAPSLPLGVAYHISDTSPTVQAFIEEAEAVGRTMG